MPSPIDHGIAAPALLRMDARAWCRRRGAGRLQAAALVAWGELVIGVDDAVRRLLKRPA